MTLGKVTGSNVYLNGQTLIGKVEEIELPDIKQKMEDYKALGYAGEFELPVGFEKMTGKIKWKAFYMKEFLQIANPQFSQMLLIRANQDESLHGSQIIHSNVSIMMNVLFKNFPLGKMSQHELSGLETEMSVYTVSQTINGVPTVTIDVFANIFMVGGVDLLLPFKLNT